MSDELRTCRHIQWQKVDLRLRSLREAELVTGVEELDRLDIAYREKYVDPGSGAQTTIFVEGDVAFRVTPRLVMAWEYATCSNRTDWEFPRELIAV